MKLLSRLSNITASFLVVLVSCRVLASASGDCEGRECAPKIGLALNGGVLVSAAGGAAIMRGFQQQTIMVDGEERPAMERFDYISGLSGGNIPTMLYVFAQNVNTNQLLDADYRIDDPSQITNKALNRKNSKSIFRVLTKSVAKNLIPLLIYHLSTKQTIQGVWPLALWFSFLRPFGIKRNKKFGTSSVKSVISPREGVTAEPLITLALVGEVQDWGLEFTQKFAATIEEFNKMGLNNTFTNYLQISKAMEKVNNIIFPPYITSSLGVGTDYSVTMKSDLSGEFQLSTELTKPSEWGATQNITRIFSLELALGMATNFATYGLFGFNAGVDTIAKANVFSQQRVIKFGNNAEKNLLFSDAGFVYGSNLPSMITNKVSKIIIPIWSTESSSKYSEIYKATKGRPLSEWATKGYLYKSVSIFFGMYDGYFPNFSQIFDEAEVHLEQLRKNFDDLYLADKPLVTTLKGVKIIDNPYYGIVGGDKVDLTILYPSMPKSFSQSVPRKTVPPPKGTNETVDEFGSFTNVEFKDFPNLAGMSAIPLNDTNIAVKTIKQVLNIGLLTTRQANMMSYFGSWLVKETWEGVSIGGQEYFGGFKELLQT